MNNEKMPLSQYDPLAMTLDKGIKPALNSIVFDTMPIVSAGLGFYYFIISLLHLYVLPEKIAYQMALLAFISSLTLFGIYALVKSPFLSKSWAHAIGSVIAGIALVNSFYHTYLTQDPLQTTNFSLLIIGTGFLFLSPLWLSFVIGTTFATWTFLIANFGLDGEWMHFGFMMFTATLISVIVLLVRLRVFKREIIMFNRLEQAQAALDERSRDLERMNQKLQYEVHERKSAEKELETLSLVASKTIHSVIITDRKGRIEWVNDSFAYITGYTLQEVQGKKPGDFLQGPKTDLITVQTIREKLLSKESFSIEILNYHKKGYPYWINLDITPLLDERGEIERFFAIQTNITEKKRVEETLQRQALTFENIHDAIVITDPSGNIQDWNPAAEKLFSYKKKEVLGLNIRMLHSPRDFGPLLSEILHDVQSSGRWYHEIQLIRKDQNIIICESTVIPLRNAYGNITALIGVYHDITKRKESENALRESEERFRSAFDNSVIGIALVALTGKYLRVNKSLCKILGYEMEELLNLDYQSLTHPDDLNECESLIEEILNNKVNDFQFEKRYIHKKGYAIWASLGVSIVRSSIGTPLYFVVQVQDITERRHHALELQLAKEEAEAASHAKSQFLANMSHELRTPLNSVIGFASILLKNKYNHLDPKELIYIERIQNNGMHLLDLINDVLDLSKIEAGHMEIEYSSVSLGDVIHDLVSQFETQIKNKGIYLCCEVPPNLLPLQTDYSKLRQILVNLIGNAIKFTEKGNVTVRVESDPRTHLPECIDVIDTGIGIPEDRRKFIFDAFLQGDSSTTRKYGGTGLGLTISRSLCQLLGYTIDVESVVNQGSSFRINLCPDLTKETPVMEPINRQDKHLVIHDI